MRNSGFVLVVVTDDIIQATVGCIMVEFDVELDLVLLFCFSLMLIRY